MLSCTSVTNEGKADSNNGDTGLCHILRLGNGFPNQSSLTDTYCCNKNIFCKCECVSVCSRRLCSATDMKTTDKKHKHTNYIEKVQNCMVSSVKVNTLPSTFAHSLF